MGSNYWTTNEGLRDGSQRLITGLDVNSTILESTVTVGASAVKLPSTPLTNRKSLMIQNLSSNLLYVGSSTVQTTSGIEILPKGSIVIRVNDSVDIYGVASGINSDLRILEGA